MHNRKCLLFKFLYLALPKTLSPHSKNQMLFIAQLALVVMETILEKQVVILSHAYMIMVHVKINPRISIF